MLGPHPEANQAVGSSGEGRP